MAAVRQPLAAAPNFAARNNNANAAGIHFTNEAAPNAWTEAPPPTMPPPRFSARAGLRRESAESMFANFGFPRTAIDLSVERFADWLAEMERNADDANSEPFANAGFATAADDDADEALQSPMHFANFGFDTRVERLRALLEATARENWGDAFVGAGFDRLVLEIDAGASPLGLNASVSFRLALVDMAVDNNGGGDGNEDDENEKFHVLVIVPSFSPAVEFVGANNAKQRFAMLKSKRRPELSEFLRELAASSGGRYTARLFFQEAPKSESSTESSLDEEPKADAPKPQRSRIIDITEQLMQVLSAESDGSNIDANNNNDDMAAPVSKSGGKPVASSSTEFKRRHSTADVFIEDEALSEEEEEEAAMEGEERKNGSTAEKSPKAAAAATSSKRPRRGT